MTKFQPDNIYRAAVDVGGTFTDLLLVSADGITALKILSTPADPEQSVINALFKSGGLDMPIVHGSTVATNAILERKGARTAFICTSGLSDIIEIGRQDRPHLYRLWPAKPEPLVPARLRFEVDERVGPGGAVIKKLALEEAKRVATEVANLKAESAAVCLLFSFEHPAHEEMLLEELEKLGVDASISSIVLPEYREYERASTTVLNAYIAPVMRTYLEKLENAVCPGNTDVGLRLMHSAGGTISSNTAGIRPVDLVLSGPAGGVVASEWLGNSLGLEQLITFDMGGTSTDVSLIDHEAAITRETKINGLPLALPMIDIHTIGAGGGSIAYVDPAGALRVGPESAGASPGPACYGKGTRPTVTDANLVLGRLIPDSFLGGRMKLQTARSVDAFMRLPGGQSVENSAVATLEVALSHMETAIKKVSLERGHDPRDFTLVAFGGAGPMHACELAQRLDIPRVIVPVFPGLFSSMGMLLASPGRDYSHSFIRPLDDNSVSNLKALFISLEKKAREDMKREGLPVVNLHFTRRVELRYQGQSHGVIITAVTLTRADILRRFDQAYQAAYGLLQKGFNVEIVNVHLSCRAPISAPPLNPPQKKKTGKPRPISNGRIYFGEMTKGDIFKRNDLSPEYVIKGPSVIVQDDTTILIPPEWQGAIDLMGNLDLDRIR